MIDPVKTNKNLMSRSSVLSWVYFALALVGFVWSWFYFVQYFNTASSFSIGPFLNSVMINHASSGVAIDVYFSAIAFSVMVVSRANTDRVKWPWLYVIVCFLVGLCVAIALYLGMRERALYQRSSDL